MYSPRCVEQRKQARGTATDGDQRQSDVMRMSSKDLKKLLEDRKVDSSNCLEKSELVQKVLQSDGIL
jgi:hypothetical protein